MRGVMRMFACGAGLAALAVGPLVGCAAAAGTGA